MSFSIEGIDHVFHLASAVGGVQYIFREHVGNLNPPCRMNLNLPEAAMRKNAKGYVFASTACVYRSRGDALNQFKGEDAFPANTPTTYLIFAPLSDTAHELSHQEKVN